MHMDLSAKNTAKSWIPRFWAKVDKRPDGCWMWTASVKEHGYGAFGIRAGLIRNAHAIAYELMKGPVPKGLELDHLCRNRACVNPDHLEAVTHVVNVRRGDAIASNHRRALARTQCAKGHPYIESNLYVNPQGRRKCRTCRKLLADKYKQAHGPLSKEYR